MENVENEKPFLLKSSNAFAVPFFFLFSLSIVLLSYLFILPSFPRPDTVFESQLPFFSSVMPYKLFNPHRNEPKKIYKAALHSHSMTLFCLDRSYTNFQ